MDIKFDIMPLITEQVNQTALLWSIAETMVPKENWDAFVKKYEKRKLIAWIDYLEQHPNVFADTKELKEMFEKKLSEL